MHPLFRRLRHRLGDHSACENECRHRNKSCEILSEVYSGTDVVITCNHDHRTVEKGLYTGVKVRVIRNEPGEPNMIIAVGDSRYVLDRRIAGRISVRKA